MRRTKIVCTIGPMTCDYAKLEKLAKAGMNVARLNMSHGDHEWHRKVIRGVRTINEKGIASISIMLDTKGPEIRSGDLKEEVRLRKGDEFTFTVRRQVEYEKYCTEVNYDGFTDDVSVGDVILIDSGLINMKVIEKLEKDIRCEVLDDGVLASRRHINIQGKSANMPSITEKDWEDIRFGIEEGVDFFALSFVKDPEAICELKDFLAKQKASGEVIAKIESAQAVTRLMQIIQASDGAMVARGDLGAEMPVEEVPIIQEEIVRICRLLGKPVIVATHMLESMIVHPTPTRAEVTDIAHAVEQGADAIMLCGETAAGKYPFKSLEVMDRVACRIESCLHERPYTPGACSGNSKCELAHSASTIATNVDAKAILVFTRRGYMATLISQNRPHPPIFAFTNMSTIRRQLNIFWGVSSWRIQFSSNPEKTIQRAIVLLKEKGFLSANDRVIVVSDILAGEELVETIQVRSIA